jgi:hypothetical protein
MNTDKRDLAGFQEPCLGILSKNLRSSVREASAVEK